MKSLSTCIVFFCVFLIGCGSRSPKIPEPVEEYPALINIHKIYIASLGNEEGADLISEKIRLRLMKTKRFTVVEVPDFADAILKGAVGISRRVHGSEGNVQTKFSAYAVLRLVNAKTAETIWSFEDSCGHWGSVSNCIADETVDKLLYDSRRAENKVK